MSQFRPEPPFSPPGPSNDPDLALFRKAAHGDSAAFHQLVDRHAQRLYRLAVNLVGNPTDAEDVLQECFAGAFRALASFQERSTVKTWLTRILMTQAARLRRSRRRSQMDSIDAASIEPPVEGDQDSVHHKADLHAALSQLSSEHRQVLVLREFEQMSYEEIAETLSIPRGTVESRIHRARADLRDKLKSYLP